MQRTGSPRHRSQSACQHPFHGQNGMAGSIFSAMKAGDGPPEPLSSINAKQRTQQKDQEKLGQKPRRRRQ